MRPVRSFPGLAATPLSGAMALIVRLSVRPGCRMSWIGQSARLQLMQLLHERNNRGYTPRSELVAKVPTDALRARRRNYAQTANSI